MEDAGLILRFITELAIYERAEDQVVATEADIRQSLFEAGSAQALICSVDGEPAGLGIRESDTPITSNLSRFVPHLIA